MSRVELPDTLTTLDHAAFASSGLTSIVIPENVTSIGMSAFDACYDLTSVTILGNVTELGSQTFLSCSSLTSVTLPDSLETIGNNAFEGCSALPSIVFPKNLTSIGASFESCYALKEIIFEGSAPTIHSQAFNAVTATCYYPAGDASWTEDVRQNYGGNLTWEPNTPPVTVIIAGACGYDLSGWLDSTGTLTVSGTGEMFDFTETSGPLWSPYRDDIKTVIIEDGAASIGDYAFYECSNLTSVSIPDSVTAIGNSAFKYCKTLTSVTLPGNIAALENSAFAYTGLTSIIIPDGISSLGAAFIGCKSLSSIDIPDSVTHISGGAFDGCSALTSIELPPNITTIEDGLFNYSGLTSIVIPEKVTSIDASAFFGCQGLTSIVIPESVTSIGQTAFGICKNLKVIEFTGNPPAINDYAFLQTTATCYYPADNTTWTDSVKKNYGGTLDWVARYTTVAGGKCGDDLSWTLDSAGTLTISGTGSMWSWAGTTGTWSSYKSDIKTLVIEEGATTLASNAFFSCDSITEVNIPDSVTTLGERAFWFCDALTSVTIGSGVTDIGTEAFYQCSMMKNFTVAAGNTVYASEAGVLFTKDKTTLLQYPAKVARTSYSIPSSVTSIAPYAFYQTKELTSITIPENVTALGKKAFSSCFGLISAVIPGSITTIPEDAFSACVNMTSVSIGNGVATVGKNAFSNCTSLKKVVLPKSVVAVNACAFSVCTDLSLLAVLNPECTLADNILYNAYDEPGIHGYTGSTAETFADSKYYDFSVHRLSKWQTIQEGSCTMEGIYTDRCTICDQTETRIVPATGHSWLAETCDASTSVCTGCGETKASYGRHEGWTEWSDPTSLPTASGSYYLTCDVTLTATWKPADGTKLCLNGRAISSANPNTIRLIEADGALTLTNCSTDNTTRYGYWDESSIYHVSTAVPSVETYDTLTGALIWGGKGTDAAYTHYNGGAIYTSSSLTLESITFAGNRGTGEGGAVNVTSYSPSLTVKSCVFIGNRSSNGGAIHATAENITLSDTVFRNNAASNAGGAMRLNDIDSVITVNNCTFISNTCNGYEGGAIYTLSKTAEFSGCTFSENSTKKYGGAIYLGQGTYTFEDNTFTNNTAGICGGGICARASEITATLNGDVLTGNTVTGIDSTSGENGLGGGLYLYVSSPINITLTGVTISGNTAFRAGGGVAISDPSSSVSGSTLTIGENTVIENNTVAAGNASNLDVRNVYNSNARPAQDLVLKCAEGLASATVGITADANTPFTSGFSTACPDTDPADLFFSDTAACTVILSGGEAAIHKHSFTNYISDGNATCGTDGTKTAVCTCGEENTVAAPGTATGDHSFTDKASTKLVETATCTSPALYLVQCDVCDAISYSLTVAVGGTADHSFTNKPSAEMAEPATCFTPASYYVQCDNCETVSDTVTIPVGEAAGHWFGVRLSGIMAEPATCTSPARYYVKCDN